MKGIHFLYIGTKGPEVKGIGLKHADWFLQQILNARDAVKDHGLPTLSHQCIPYDDAIQPMTMNRGDGNNNHIYK
jgi:hypothetical protein